MKKRLSIVLIVAISIVLMTSCFGAQINVNSCEPLSEISQDVHEQITNGSEIAEQGIKNNDLQAILDIASEQFKRNSDNNLDDTLNQGVGLIGEDFKKNETYMKRFFLYDQTKI